MRTTLTLDDDVAILLDTVREARQAGLKEVANEALRLGLHQMASPPLRHEKFATRVVDPGRCRLPNLDNVAEVLAFAEGVGFR
jgi:hypothetical protein